MTDEYRDVKMREWWCPSAQRWGACDGPCPDGTPHGPMRVVTVRTRIVRDIADWRANRAEQKPTP